MACTTASLPSRSTSSSSNTSVLPLVRLRCPGADPVGEALRTASAAVPGDAAGPTLPAAVALAAAATVAPAASCNAEVLLYRWDGWRGSAASGKAMTSRS
jgi:hypothetical protein